MIKLIVEDYCQNCPNFEAVVTKESRMIPVDFTSMRAEEYNDTYINCEHRARCECFKKYIEREINNG